MTGGEGDDKVTGGKGDDIVKGGAGDDILQGSGDDVLIGDGKVENGVHTECRECRKTTGYHNSYGYYVMGDDGKPSSGQIIWADVKDSVGQTFNLEGVDKDKVGFFLIPNGDNVNKGLTDGQDVTFEQDKNGKWSPVIGGEALKGQSGATLSDTELNKGDYEYLRDSVADGNQKWEDLGGGGGLI